jgi:hypothetical protein
MNFNVFESKLFFYRLDFAQKFILLTWIMKKIHYQYTSEPLCLKVFTQGKRPLGYRWKRLCLPCLERRKITEPVPHKEGGFFILGYENS